MVEVLGFDEATLGDKAVAIIVGPNGSGKSNFLKRLALQNRQHRNVIAICNASYDRLTGVRDIKRLSSSGTGGSPKKVIKEAVAFSIEEPDSTFYQMGVILDYCGYKPRFGFRVIQSRKIQFGRFPYEGHEDPQAVNIGTAFLERHNPREIIWIDQYQSALNFSQAREFAGVLRNESSLRAAGIIRDVQVLLERKDGEIIALHHASSGELSLISSLVFLITAAKEQAIVLIDEPENSLHPSWQREYVDKILTAMNYRDAAIIVATHAPLVVTGAVASAPEVVSVFQIQDGAPHQIDLGSTEQTTGGIEEILWRAFDVITPANHFVSEEIATVLSRFD